MIVDSSVIVAILGAEPDASDLRRALAGAWPRRISAATLLETGIALESRGGAGAALELDAFLDRAGIQVVAVTAEQAVVARQAWRRFGRGNHPAALNFGDCFVYALAKTMDEPLLFKGDDFSLTDLARA